jgi:hypothetical protein
VRAWLQLDWKTEDDDKKKKENENGLIKDPARKTGKKGIDRGKKKEQDR